VAAKVVRLNLGGLRFRVYVEIVDHQGTTVRLEREFDTRGAAGPADTTVSFEFAESAIMVSRISMYVLSIDGPSKSPIHVREFRLTN
jgi:hypothetical protein